MRAFLNKLLKRGKPPGPRPSPPDPSNPSVKLIRPAPGLQELALNAVHALLPLAEAEVLARENLELRDGHPSCNAAESRALINRVKVFLGNRDRRPARFIDPF